MVEEETSLRLLKTQGDEPIDICPTEDSPRAKLNNFLGATKKRYFQRDIYQNQTDLMLSNSENFMRNITTAILRARNE